MKQEDKAWFEWQKVKAQIIPLKVKLRELMIRETELASKLVQELQAQPTAPLTRRQMEIVNLIKTHPTFTNKELAEVLFVSERTVKFHVSIILQRYAVRTKQELVMRFFEGKKGAEQNADIITYRAAHGPGGHERKRTVA
jgi:DNA-binding CsgD family transcriptional regulator